MDPFLNVSAIIKIFNCYCNGRPLTDLELSKISDKVDVNLQNVFCDIDRNYLMSPMWVPDQILEKFPPTSFLSVDTDPCLDGEFELVMSCLSRFNHLLNFRWNRILSASKIPQDWYSYQCSWRIMSWVLEHSSDMQGQSERFDEMHWDDWWFN